MPQRVRVRSIQAGLALAYGLLAAIAVARTRSLLDLGIALAMLLGAHLTARTIPDAWIERTDLPRACGVGLLVILAGITATVLGGHSVLVWAVVVMAYCAGNRLKAAGIGVAG